MEPKKKIRLKIQLMHYFIINQGEFATKIAKDLEHTHADVYKVLGELETLDYIHPAPSHLTGAKRKISVRKRNYWIISHNIRILKKIYDDPEFEVLQSEMRIQPWVAEIATKKVQEFPPDIVTLVFEMISTSPSFFEVMMSHETFDEMKDFYRAHFITEILYSVGVYSEFVDYWFLYHLCLDCNVKDKEKGNPTGKSDIILFRMSRTLKSMASVSVQKEPNQEEPNQEKYIRNLESVIFTIELIMPFWGDRHQGLKLSLERYIGEFRDACKRARLAPDPNLENAEYTTLYHVIIRELIDEKEGNPLDY